MLYFTIALRGVASTNQWDLVQERFEKTLCSIYNQTNPDFCVYVGCNEIPELHNAFDKRLHFVEVDTPRPKDWLDGCRDRAWKQLACCAAIKHDLGVVPPEGLFVFPVDADDYVSNRLAEYVSQNPEANGFKSKRSYKWFEGSNRLELTPYFGGSMNIMKLKPDEFPDEMPDISLCFDKGTCVLLNEKYPVRWNDFEVERKMEALGRPFRMLPFCSTIYVLNTGANLSSDDPKFGKKKDDRIHFGVLLKKANPFIWKRIDQEICTEFGIERLH